MDKELIQRLIKNADQRLADQSSQLRRPAFKDWCECFAALVAEECAKIAETAEGETVCLEAYSRQARIQRDASARAIRAAFQPSTSLAATADQVITEELARDQAGRKQPFGLDALVEEISRDDGKGRPPPQAIGGLEAFTFRSPPPKEAPMPYLTPWVVETFVRLHSTPPDESGYVTAGHIMVSVKRLADMSLNEFVRLVGEHDARVKAMKG